MLSCIIAVVVFFPLPACSFEGKKERVVDLAVPKQLQSTQQLLLLATMKFMKLGSKPDIFQTSNNVT